MKKKVLLTTCVLSGLFISNANAQVVYLHHNNPSVQSNINLTTPPHIEITPAPISAPVSSVSSSVTNGNNVMPASDFGRDEPIETAVSSIIPSDYRVIWSGVDKNKKVSWSGGRPWSDVLNTLVEANGYSLIFNNKNITISGQDNIPNVSITPVSTPPVAQPTLADTRPIATDPIPARTQHSTSENIQANLKSSIGDSSFVEPSSDSSAKNNKLYVLKTQYANNSGNMITANSKAKEISSMPTASYAPQGGGAGIYYAASGSQLDQVLQIWSNANGWRLDYEAKMFYPIDLPVTLNGDYMESVKTLMRAIQESTTPKPKYKFYMGNHTLRIYNADDGN